jgi:uncharacterized membrane protein
MLDKKTCGIAIGMGVVSGMRSLSALAFISHRLSNDMRGKRMGRTASLLKSEHVSGALTALAAGEMAADKLPVIPPRTEAAPLFGRAAMGALAGAVVADVTRGARLPAALLGSVAAVVSTLAFYRIRKEAGESTGIPDGVLAMLEDALVLTLGSRLSQMLVDD